MSNTVLWGTNIATAQSATRWRQTSEDDLRVTDSGDIRLAFIPPSQVIFDRITSVGDQRVTSEGDDRVTIDGLQGPQYFQTANVTTDGGEPFEFSDTTNPWQPDAQGGECVFRWAYVTLSWSMGAAVRLSALVDGSGDDVTLENGDVMEMVRSTFVLPQQSGALNRKTAMFPVPLVQRILAQGDSDNEVSRGYIRGQRLQLLIESTGALGTGELILEGVQVDLEPVRKATYITVQSP